MRRSLLDFLSSRDRLSAGDLLKAFGGSRATLARAVRAAGTGVLKMGRGRRTGYAARRSLRGSLADLPIFRINEDGDALPAGVLQLAVADGCIVLEQPKSLWPMTIDMRDGWYDGMPYFLQDCRPSGFMGRAFARRVSDQLLVSLDPRQWSDDDTWIALSLFGSDLPGDLVVGEPAYGRWLEETETESHVENIEARYPELAARALDGDVAASYAAGEFPKFTALVRRGDRFRRVIVKFSGSDDSPGARRGADLLVCEAIAAQVLGQSLGADASRSRIVQAAGRTFLEVERFDRHGQNGRSPLVSWASVNNAWFGSQGISWPEGADRLFKAGLITADTSLTMKKIWYFGQLIGNTDMHDHNLSFRPNAPQFDLAPVYDMLPMAYAPKTGLELPTVRFKAKLSFPADRELCRDAAVVARSFWNLASTDSGISSQFRAVCVQNADVVSGH